MKLHLYDMFMVFALCLAVFYFGYQIGISDYKAQCEPMSTNAYQVQWYECKV